MSAPALIVLADDSVESATTITAIGDLAACMRPDLSLRTAMNHTEFLASVADLHQLGHCEIVVVPLDIASGRAAETRAEKFIESAQSIGPSLIATEAIGMSSALLRVVDEKLRSAVSGARVDTIDALVLAGLGTNDELANHSVVRAARIWGNRHRLPAIAAFAQAVPPAVSEAVRSHREQRRRHIVVGSLFLSAGPLYSRVKELALEAGALAVSEPIGAHPEIAHALLARYAVGALGLVEVEALFA